MTPIKTLFAAGLLAFAAQTARAQLIISEFMASNSHTLADEDGSFEDWIEIQNVTTSTVNLAGWYLTDSSTNLREWQFPATNLSGGGFLVVFASSKNRQVPGNPLHTNFKLNAGGEYLALVRPDGITKATEFAPTFPPQLPDISYGFGLGTSSMKLVVTNALLRVVVPGDGSFGTDWTLPAFDDTGWLLGTNGIGYETGLSDPLENSYVGQVLSTAQAAYWRLDESNGLTAMNLGSLGASANGSYQGSVTLGTPGPRPLQFPSFEPDNRAPTFNGADSYVGGPGPLLNNLSQFSMAGWIRPTGTEGGRTGLFGQNDVVEFGFIDASTIQLWSFFGALNATYPFAANEWHHVCAVGDGVSLKLYFDGLLSSTANAPTAGFGSSGDNFNIGGGGVYDPSGNWFLGQIDEVALWQRAILSNEVSQLVSSGAGAQVSFVTNIATDLRDLMYTLNSAAYVRIPFIVTNPANIDQLTLRMKYDDGFVAYLNGQEVARQNAPDTIAWNSQATVRHPDSLALQFEDFDISASRFLLFPGTNILAIQGLNIAATNTDFLIQSELVAGTINGSNSQPGYFTQPSPGTPNSFAGTDAGPIISAVGQTPSSLPFGTNLVVSARVSATLSPVSNVVLSYRVMFGPETPVPMNDSGTNGDLLPGDGIWTATIPGGSATNGQMIRFYIAATDVSSNYSRWPLFPNAATSEQYLGAVVINPSIQSLLPVLHVFVENPTAADNSAGTRCSLFYRGEFYDNVVMNLHGGVTRGFPKKSYHFGFSREHHFAYQSGRPRVSDIDVLTNWGDKSKTHNTLSYQFVAQVGSLGHFAFPVRMQRNGFFYSTYDMLEFGNEDWLTRLGRDPNGALYKMDNDLSNAFGNTKRTRTFEDHSDLQALVDNLNETQPLATRALYAYDNLDLPQCVSYFVALALASSQDHGHKNYYVYRDSLGSREWSIIPWDVDLTWGRNWIDASGYLTDTLYQDNSLSFYNSAQQGKPVNRLYDLVFDSPDFRRMYLRRLRTVMDTVLKSASSASQPAPIETNIKRLMDLFAPTNIAPNDAALDSAKWGYWGLNTQMRQEAQRIIDVHLPGRRAFLFSNPAATLRGERIPSSQPANAVVNIVASDANPVSGNQTEEFIQLANMNAFAMDLSGWKLAGAVDFTFKPGTVLPAGASLYATPDVSAFRARLNSPHGGQGLFVQGNYNGHLNAWGETVQLSDDTGRVVAAKTFVGNPSLAQRYLRITELMYNPPPLAGNTNEAQEFEYIELRNISTDLTLDLNGIRFTNGVYFPFTSGAVTSLLPGQSVLAVRNLAAFTARYGSGFNIAGQYTGHLANEGDTLRLEDAAGEKILEFTYDNHWYPITDGLGFSLVIVDENAPWYSWGLKESWRVSAASNGSPGMPDPATPLIFPVLINEVLAHATSTQAQAIELFNPTTSAVDLGGWFLSDDLASPKKFRLPVAFVLPPDNYAVFTGVQLEQGTIPFRLSAAGGSVFLFSADASSNLTGYAHGFSFGPSPQGQSLGRYVNSLGDEDLVLQSAATIGTNNTPPLVGPIVVSEIFFHPPDLGGLGNPVDEFIELQNISLDTVPLFDLVHPTNTWRLRNAVDFDFPTNTWLVPQTSLLVVGFDPSDPVQLNSFRAAYVIPANTPILGPWNGTLNNSGETIELKRPDQPLLTATNTIVPYILVEKVHYLSQAPWPTNTDGTGNSLQRIATSAFGNDPANWFGANPTAGRLNWDDADNDGMPDWWESANGTDWLINDANADPDADGLTNLQEYWAGTNPNDPNSTVRFETVRLSAGTNIVLSFNAIAGHLYRVQHRQTLGSGNWSDLTSIDAAPTNRLVWVTNTTLLEPSSFYRLLVNPQ